jgi:hypothetical protein
MNKEWKRVESLCEQSKDLAHLEKNELFHAFFRPFTRTKGERSKQAYLDILWKKKAVAEEEDLSVIPWRMARRHGKGSV